MDFQWTDSLSVPRGQVFATRRDRVVELVPHMRNVVSIELRGVERHASGVLVTRTRWRGEPGEIPAPIRPLIPPEMVWWTETCTWDPVAWTCTWTITLPVLPEAVTARGVNRYLEADGGTRVEMTGELTVHADRLPPVPGVPAFLVKQAVPTLEGFVVKLLEPNLKEANRAVERLLQDGR